MVSLKYKFQNEKVTGYGIYSSTVSGALKVAAKLVRKFEDKENGAVFEMTSPSFVDGEYYMTVFVLRSKI